MPRPILTVCITSSILLALAAAPVSAQCNVHDAAFSDSFRGNLNLDFNDYGRIAEDARDPACAQAALYALSNKLDAHLSASGAFQGWLDGYLVALVFSAANHLGENGWASKDLHVLLDDVLDTYSLTRSCGGLETTDTCMDDDAGAAAAHAWIAAYMYRRQSGAGYTNSEVEAHRTQSRQSIASFFDNVCIHHAARFANDRTTLCNGTVAELATGAAKTLSLNHGYQNIPYGFGLMTSIASAVHGLEVSGSGHS